MKALIYASLLVVSFLSCTETPKPASSAPTATPVASAPVSAVKDTVIGINGCEKAKLEGKAFVYSSAKVTVKENSDGNAGEVIEVNGTAIPTTPENAHNFAGVYKNFLFIDDGTGTNGRILKIWGIQEKKILFQTPYEGELNLAGDKVSFIQPIDLSTVKLAKPVNCPDKAKWTKGGLSVGYGIPQQYDLAKLAATPAGDAVCFAIQ